MREYVVWGTTAQRERGSDAWRRRQMYSISVWGRARVFSTSMKEDRSLIPGGAEGFGGMEVLVDEVSPVGWGGGGGG